LRKAETADLSPITDAPVRDAPQRGGTLSSVVYSRLREDILRAELLPGTKLRGELVRDRYGIGGSPIREALTRLAAEKLVRHEEQRGFFVAGVSRAELVELTETRCWLEEIGLRRSVAMGDGAWEERVVLATHRMTRTPRWLDDKASKTNPEWEGLHNDYHEALISACGSQWLLEFCRQLRDRTYRYRQLSAVKWAGVPRQEHERISAKAVDRDVDEAVALLMAHYRKTMEVVLTHYEDASAS